MTRKGGFNSVFDALPVLRREDVENKEALLIHIVVYPTSRGAERGRRGDIREKTGKTTWTKIAAQRRLFCYSAEHTNAASLSSLSVSLICLADPLFSPTSRVRWGAGNSREGR